MKRPIPRNSWLDRDVEAHWDAVASVYVKENERVKDAHDQRFRESVENLQLEDGVKILNISSRDGEATDYIQKEKPGCEVINAEISNRLMEVATRIRPGINQVKISTYSKLPFSDGEFDRVLSLETLEHVADPLEFLKELYRVSAEKAILVLSCPPATSEIPYRIYSLLFGGHGEGPHRFPPSGRVRKMFAMTGWNLLVHKGTVLFPVGPAWFQKWGERMIGSCQKTFISELGIRQFYVCNKK
ncbi:MAG: class I SAM-dependent methyltransferase [Bacteroidales bacterium]|nr:class I SAM-dependent methyltransferase [Bacteroidales bacterium]